MQTPVPSLNPHVLLITIIQSFIIGVTLNLGMIVTMFSLSKLVTWYRDRNGKTKMPDVQK